MNIQTLREAILRIFNESEMLDDCGHDHQGLRHAICDAAQLCGIESVEVHAISKGDESGDPGRVHLWMFNYAKCENVHLESGDYMTMRARLREEHEAGSNVWLMSKEGTKTIIDGQGRFTHIPKEKQ